MKLIKRAAVLAVTVLTAAVMAAPVSAHHGRGGYNCIIAAANVLGQTAQSVMEQVRASGSCVGAMMTEMGKQSEFQAEKLRLKKEQLQAQVENGKRTQEQADAVLETMETRQAVCDGTGNGRGLCDGSLHESGICDGTCGGQSWGNGVCDGTGNGRGLCDGSLHESGICDGTCGGQGWGNGNGACDGTGQGQGYGRGNGNGGGHHNGRHGCH